jgi:hypothetical protein
MVNEKPNDPKKPPEAAQMPPSGGTSSADAAASARPKPIVLELRSRGKGKKRKRYTAGTKPIQEFGYGLSKAGSRMADSISDGLGTFVKRSRKSSRKKRDGMIRDVLRNVSLGISDGVATAGKAPYDIARRIRTRRFWRTFRTLTPGSN